VQITPVMPELVQGLGLPNAAGALVARVGAGSPAAMAGFEPGDIILSINGRAVARTHDLPLTVAEMPIGETAKVTVWRRNATLTLQPKIGEMPTDLNIAELRRSKLDRRQPDGGTPAPALASAI